MKFGIIKERKNPPDRRVVFSPEELVTLQEKYPQVKIAVESSDVRVFTDQEYANLGFSVTQDLSDCDVLLGVKEVPVTALISNKTYFFFSHTIKKQPHNQKLLRACLDKNIELIDYETIVDATGHRLIGFGRYAGIVGAYNAFRAFGIKFDLFNLPAAETLKDKNMLLERLKRPYLPPIKIVLTGHGKVGQGAKEILKGMKIKEVSKHDFLTITYTYPVFVQLDVLDYNKRIDGKQLENHDFYQNPQEYESNFERFSKVADMYIAGHFHNVVAPKILTQQMLKAADCKIKVIADISCDIPGPIDSTLRTSTIASPFYGYYPSAGAEVDINHPGAVVVMAVDNLPCALPQDASEGFGEMFLQHVMPSFFNGDKDGILQRATITKNGQLTPRFAYLQDYVDGKKEVV